MQLVFQELKFAFVKSVLVFVRSIHFDKRQLPGHTSFLCVYTYLLLLIAELLMALFAGESFGRLILPVLVLCVHFVPALYTRLSLHHLVRLAELHTIYW